MLDLNAARRSLASFLVAATFVAAAPLGAQQADPAQSYSATAIHSLPGQPETRGQVVKSGGNMRLEFEQNGRKVVQILLPQQGVMYILEPDSKTYLEIKGQAVPAPVDSGPATPCNEQSGLALCQRVGTDTVSGIQVERWQLAQQPQTKPLVILWDPTRNHALRQDFPDGSSTSMAFKSMVEMNGRPVEHWVTQITAPGREPLTGGWWFDPELRVVVREELPGGEVRRLEDISVGPVDPAAFQVPEGWTKRDPAAIAPPRPQPPQPPQPSSN